MELVVVVFNLYVANHQTAEAAHLSLVGEFEHANGRADGATSTCGRNGRQRGARADRRQALAAIVALAVRASCAVHRSDGRCRQLVPLEIRVGLEKGVLILSN